MVRAVESSKKSSILITISRLADYITEWKFSTESFSMFLSADSARSINSID